MAQVDPADVGSHIQPYQRETGYRWLQPRIDSTPVADDLNPDTRRNDDRDTATPGIDMQVDNVIVELGLGEVKPYAAQIRADMRLPGDLPSAHQPQPPDPGVDLQRLRQPPFRARQDDGLRQ